MVCTFRKKGGLFWSNDPTLSSVCEVVGCEKAASHCAYPKGGPELPEDALGYGTNTAAPPPERQAGKFNVCMTHAGELGSKQNESGTLPLKREQQMKARWRVKVKTIKETIEEIAEELGYERDVDSDGRVRENFCRWHEFKGADDPTAITDILPRQNREHCSNPSVKDSAGRWRVKGSQMSACRGDIRLCDKHLQMLYAERNAWTRVDESEGFICECTDNPDGRWHGNEDEAALAIWRRGDVGDYSQRYGNFLCDEHYQQMRKEQGAVIIGTATVLDEDVKPKKKTDYDKKIAKLLTKFAGTAKARRIEVEREMYGAEETYKRLKRESVA